MEEKIKIVYLILGIPFLILLIAVLTVRVYKQINQDFFTFNRRECVKDYFRNNASYSHQYIRNLSDKEIDIVSQIWSLNKEELLMIKERDKIAYKEFKKRYEDCRAEAEEREKNMFAGLFECEEQDPSISVPDLTINKEPIITDSLVKELILERTCLRPSLLK